MWTSDVTPAGTLPAPTPALWSTPGPRPGTAPLAGAVVVQYIMCGKPGCRCRDGQEHGPCHDRVCREGPNVHKVYVRPEDLETVRAQCATHQQIRAALRDAQERRLALLRQIACRRRECDRLIRGG